MPPQHWLAPAFQRRRRMYAHPLPDRRVYVERTFDRGRPEPVFRQVRLADVALFLRCRLPLVRWGSTLGMRKAVHHAASTRMVRNQRSWVIFRSLANRDVCIHAPITELVPPSTTMA